MRLHRFYIGGEKGINKGQNNSKNAANAGQKPLSDLDISSKVLIDAGSNDNESSLIHQWRDVFRYTAGSRVVLFDDSKTECLCMIESITMTRAELVVIEKSGSAKASGVASGSGTEKDSKKAKGKMKKVTQAEKAGQQSQETVDIRQIGKVLAADTFKGMSESSSGKAAKKSGSGEVWLLASIIKNDNFDLIIQKTTELGVDHIVPILSDRTIKKDINMKRALRIAIEASEQSGRISVPVIHEPAMLKKAIEQLMIEGGEAVVCSQHGKDWTDMKPFLKKYPVGFVIGPEGGWSEREEAYFKTSGFKMMSIGQNVLRAETAAISTVALIKIS